MIKPVQSTEINFNGRYCYIPKCKAHCCSSMPLPGSLVTFSKLRNKQARRIYLSIPAPENNQYCNHAFIAVTQPQNLLKTITLKNGQKTFMLDTKQIYNAQDNYCPYLTEIGKCNIYKKRPQVCRDFGKKGCFDCDEKISLKELIKYKVQDIMQSINKQIFKSKK